MCWLNHPALNQVGGKGRNPGYCQKTMLLSLVQISSPHGSHPIKIYLCFSHITSLVWGTYTVSSQQAKQSFTIVLSEVIMRNKVLKIWHWIKRFSEKRACVFPSLKTVYNTWRKQRAGTKVPRKTESNQYSTAFGKKRHVTKMLIVIT